jgi:hypothetical protein
MGLGPHKKIPETTAPQHDWRDRREMRKKEVNLAVEDRRLPGLPSPLPNSSPSCAAFSSNSRFRRNKAGERRLLANASPAGLFRTITPTHPQSTHSQSSSPNLNPNPPSSLTPHLPTRGLLPESRGPIEFHGRYVAPNSTDLLECCGCCDGVQVRRG